MSLWGLKLPKTCRQIQKRAVCRGGLHSWVGEDDHVVSKKENGGGELVHCPDESAHHTDIFCLILAWSKTLEAQKAATLLFCPSVLSAGKWIQWHHVVTEKIKTKYNFLLSCASRSCSGPIRDDKKFSCSLHCIRPLFYIWNTCLHFCRNTPLSLAFSCFLAVVFVMFYSTPESTPVLFCFRIFFWSLSLKWR